LLRLDPDEKCLALLLATLGAIRVFTISSERSKLTSVVAEYERLGHRLRISASA